MTPNISNPNFPASKPEIPHPIQSQAQSSNIAVEIPEMNRYTVQKDNKINRTNPIHQNLKDQANSKLKNSKSSKSTSNKRPNYAYFSIHLWKTHQKSENYSCTIKSENKNSHVPSSNKSSQSGRKTNIHTYNYKQLLKPSTTRILLLKP